MKITITTRQTVSISVNFDVVDGAADRFRSVEGDIQLYRGRNFGAELRQQRFDVVDHFNRVGAGLPLHGQDHRRARH